MQVTECRAHVYSFWRNSTHLFSIFTLISPSFAIRRRRRVSTDIPATSKPSSLPSATFCRLNHVRLGPNPHRTDEAGGRRGQG
jgi:hypothetical protein